jgi:hypothetical protein
MNTPDDLQPIGNAAFASADEQYQQLCDENAELRCTVNELKAKNAELREMCEQTISQRDQAMALALRVARRKSAVHK